MSVGLQGNLERYPWLHVGRNALFWVPVFVLYFSSALSPAEVLRLEALYYAGVVVLEVPSGYLSDRVGRRPTLLLASVAWVLGSATLAVGGSFPIFAAGQLLLAAGMALQSGTDTSLLYDTLAALGREAEFAQREASAQSRAFATLAVSALIGGGIASLDLRLGHALSALAGCVAVVAAAGLVEPPRHQRAAAPLDQAVQTVLQLRDPVLRWTLAHGLGLVVAIHVPYELMQPWLEHLVAPLDPGGALAATPPVAGVATFVMMTLAAVLGPRGPRLATALGTPGALLASWALLVGVIGAMATAIHPVILPMIALRSVPFALAGPLLAATTHPRLPSGLRATWLSVQSLAGRLAFALLLALAARAIDAHDSWSIEAMDALLVPAAALSGLWAVGLWWLQPDALRQPDPPRPAQTPPDPGSPR